MISCRVLFSFYMFFSLEWIPSLKLLIIQKLTTAVLYSSAVESQPTKQIGTHKMEDTAKPACIFAYQPLPETRCIRLLKIVDANSATLAVQVQVFALNALPKYQALSYTWGKATRTKKGGNEVSDRGIPHDITCDSSTLSVTENLFDALCELGQLGRFDYYWIDAICIDQGNLKERSSQVLLMGEIYASAQQVVVWLGKDTTDLGDILWTNQVFIDFVHSHDDWDFLTMPPFDPEMLCQLGISAQRWTKYWKSYGRFYRRHRWFSRAWITQEVAMASKIVVRCGQATLDFERMAEVSIILRYSINWWAELIESGPGKPSISTDATQLALTRRIVQRGGPEEASMKRCALGLGADSPEHQWYCFLYYLITFARNFEASDLHDKIYAVLGIASRFLPADLDIPVIPDYSLSVPEIYSRTSALLLKHVPRLQLLSQVECSTSRQLEGLPSWSPDYSCYINKMPLTLFLHGTTAIQECCFHVCGALEADCRPRCRVSGSVLMLEGKSLDTIVSVTPPIETHIMQQPSIEPLFDICLGLDEMYRMTQQDRLEVLWRTIIADSIPVMEPLQTLLHPAPDFFVDNFTEWVLHWSAISIASGKDRGYQEGVINKIIDAVELRNSVYRGSSVSLPSLDLVLERVKVADALYKDWTHRLEHSTEWSTVFGQKQMDFQRAISRIGRGRCVFRSGQKLLGLGPESSRTGDELWLIRSALTPVILRREEGTSNYLLIGEAYVHGIMHGEMMDETGFDHFTEISIV
jgi:hypothetical protein